jgi:hypothetical protein
LDIPIEPMGATDRRQRGARDLRACAHRHLEQISGVVSPDIPPYDYSGGARGWAAADAGPSANELVADQRQFSFVDRPDHA